MSKLVESFLTDALQHEKVQSTIQQILAKILEFLTPLLIAISIIWGLTLLVSTVSLVVLLKKGGGGGV
jgi:hypothetical protein